MKVKKPNVKPPVVPTEINDTPPPPIAPMNNLFIRLIWLLYGNAVLGICWFSIASRGIRTFDIADYVYLGTIVIMLMARHVDINRFQGHTADGTPATMLHFKRYAIQLVSIGIVMWIAAQFIAYYKWL